MAKSQQQMVARPATILTSYHTSMIRRRNLLKAAIEKLETMEKKYKAKLDPVLDAECGKEEKVCVEVKGTVIRLTKVEKDVPKYKDLLDQLADEATLKLMLGETDVDGNPIYTSHQSYVIAKFLGRNTSIDALVAKS